MADQQGSTLSGSAAAFVPNAAAPPRADASNATASAGTNEGRGRGRERGRGRGRDGRGNKGRGRGRGRGRSAGKGRGGRAPSAAEATLVEMGYAPAAARRRWRPTGSVEAAISALDPGYCAAVDTQARGNATTCCASRRNGPSNNHRRGGARRERGARTGRRHRLPRAPSIRLLVAAGVASPFACRRRRGAALGERRRGGCCW